MKKIAVFCSASSQIDPLYTTEAQTLGDWIGSHGCMLVYGGSARGLMEVTAAAVHATGGRVKGVIPRKFAEMKMTSQYTHEVVVTADMQERKRVMLQESDAVVILPGGPGTIDEFFDAYVSRKLGYITAPIIVCNTGGYYNALLAQLERCYSEQFASPMEAAFYSVAANAAHACRLLQRFFPDLNTAQL